MALKRNFMGKNIIVNLFTKHGYRVSPGGNVRTRAVGRCATGLSLQDRKDKCYSKTTKEIYAANPSWGAPTFKEPSKAK